MSADSDSEIESQSADTDQGGIENTPATQTFVIRSIHNRFTMTLELNGTTRSLLGLLDQLLARSTMNTYSSRT